MPFLALLHRCRNISVGARKRGQAEGDAPGGTRKKTREDVRQARARSHRYARARKRSHVSASPRVRCAREYESRAEVGASPGRRRPRWKKCETSKNNGTLTKLVRETLV